MPLSLAYWIIMLIWLIFGVVWAWPSAAAGHYGPLGGNVLLFVLLLLLGWQVFGNPING